MAIDLTSEQLMSLSKAARECPGGKVSAATIWRWHLHGRRGIRLESVLRGGTRMTSKEALIRFFAAVTAVVDGAIPSARTEAQRRRAIDQADRELSDMGG
jgi:hypothetical protein